MEKIIAVLAGDGIGEEVMAEALRVLSALSNRCSHSFKLQRALVGGAAFERYGVHFPEETKEICASCDAVLFGSVGGPLQESQKPKWKNCEANSILALRKAFNFSINFRPACVYPALMDISPLRRELLEGGVDLIVVRELLGDIYFGEHRSYQQNGERVAFDSGEYSEKQIALVAHAAFKLARTRRKKVCSVDKANVLEMSRLWRQVVAEVSREYEDVQLENMLVDNCSMQIVRNPAQFDIILTGNMFGDILSDIASVLPASLGLLPSASINPQGFGLYEPCGGSAPDIAGQGIANPIAQILSVAMMLRLSFSLHDEALMIENAVNKTLAAGYRTKDIFQKNTTLLGTKEITDQIIASL